MLFFSKKWDRCSFSCHNRHRPASKYSWGASQKQWVWSQSCSFIPRWWETSSCGFGWCSSSLSVCRRGGWRFVYQSFKRRRTALFALCQLLIFEQKRDCSQSSGRTLRAVSLLLKNPHGKMEGRTRKRKKKTKTKTRKRKLKKENENKK